MVITEKPNQKCKSLSTPVDYFYDGIAAYVSLVLDELPDLQGYGAGVTSKQNLVDSFSLDGRGYSYPLSTIPRPEVKRTRGPQRFVAN